MDFEAMIPNFPKLEVLRPLSVSSITAEHLAHLPSIAEANWNGLSAEDIVDEIRDGRVQMWEAGESVVLTRLERGPAEAALILDGLSDPDILWRGEAVVRDLQLVARYHGVQRIETSAADPRWGAMATRHGFKAVSTNYSKEVDYG